MNTEHAIDAHVHLWTSDVAAYPLAAGYGYPEGEPTDFTADDFLQLARSIGVQRAVLIQSDFYGFDNSYLLAALQRFPAVFTGVAQVDEFGADPAAELSRLIPLGVGGLRIMSPSSGKSTWLAPPGMHALWQRAATDHIPICPLIDALDLAAVSHMCRRFPETSVVVDHAANIGSDGQFRESDMQSLCDLAEFPSTYVKVSGFYYLGTKRPPYTEVVPLIRRLLDAFGPERLMWGSDCPFQLKSPNTYIASLELIRDRLGFLSLSDKEWLLHRTAAKVFCRGLSHRNGASKSEENALSQ